MPVQIILDVSDFDSLQSVVPKDSPAGGSLARVRARYNGAVPTDGTVEIVCDEAEALDLLDHAQKASPETFSIIRQALRKANFGR